MQMRLDIEHCTCRQCDQICSGSMCACRNEKCKYITCTATIGLLSPAMSTPNASWHETHLFSKALTPLSPRHCPHRTPAVHMKDSCMLKCNCYVYRYFQCSIVPPKITQADIQMHNGLFWLVGYLQATNSMSYHVYPTPYMFHPVATFLYTNYIPPTFCVVYILIVWEFPVYPFCKHHIDFVSEACSGWLQLSQVTLKYCHCY